MDQPILDVAAERVFGPLADITGFHGVDVGIDGQNFFPLPTRAKTLPRGSIFTSSKPISLQSAAM
jgi:hypothetical protein